MINIEVLSCFSLQECCISSYFHTLNLYEFKSPWRYSKAIKKQDMLLGIPGVGQYDLHKSLPTSAILWFCDLSLLSSISISEGCFLEGIDLSGPGEGNAMKAVFSHHHNALWSCPETCSSTPGVPLPPVSYLPLLWSLHRDRLSWYQGFFSSESGEILLEKSFSNVLVKSWFSTVYTIIALKWISISLDPW